MRSWKRWGERPLKPSPSPQSTDPPPVPNSTPPAFAATQTPAPHPDQTLHSPLLRSPPPRHNFPMPAYKPAASSAHHTHPPDAQSALRLESHSPQSGPDIRPHSSFHDGFA